MGKREIFQKIQHINKWINDNVIETNKNQNNIKNLTSITDHKNLLTKNCNPRIHGLNNTAKENINEIIMK